MGQPLRRQRDHQIIDPRQPTLTLAHDHRLKRGLPIPGHLNLHRTSLSHQRFRPRPIPRVPAIPAGWIVLAITQMIVHLALQGGLDHHLRQPGQQATFPGQLQALGPRPRCQLPHQLLVQAVSRLSRHIHRHKSHRCPFRLRSYTVDRTVPQPGTTTERSAAHRTGDTVSAYQEIGLSAVTHRRAQCRVRIGGQAMCLLK